MPCPAAGPAIEIAADQQEEEERDRRIEVGMLLARPRFVQADEAGQRDADRDRHVHVGAAGAQGGEGRAEEGLAGIGDGGQGDGRGQKVEQRARRLAHRTVMARPDGDREQHDVGRGEARDRQGAQEIARLAIVLRRDGERVVGRETEAERRHQPGMGVGLGRRAAPGERQAPRRQVHARLRDGRVAGQQALDQPDAGRAVESVDQQFERALVLAVFARMAREVDLQRFGPSRPPFLEARIEAAQAGGADDGVRTGAAAAAEFVVAPSAHRRAAMRTGVRRAACGRCGEEGGVGHLRNIRCVCAKRSPSRSTTMSRSQLPRAGRSTWPA